MSLPAALTGHQWQTLEQVYYTLHTPTADATARREAAHWRDTHRNLYDSFLAQLDEVHRAASVALQHAWAPYSGFPVGAALLSTDGTIWHGCNVECSSYGLTLCAERVALGTAVANGRREFVLLVLLTDTDAPIAPCGACRQLLHDFAPQLLILAEAARPGERALWFLSELLPNPFSGKDIWDRYRRSTTAVTHRAE